MRDDDWYRNTSWDPRIAAQFEAKLKRARDKEQYLRIQALSLVGSNPGVSLQLLDRYFALGSNFVDCAEAHAIRAKAYLNSGQVDDAIAAYEATLKRESEFPNFKTLAAIDYPYLVATRNLTKYLARALDVLDANREDVAFPVGRFRWHAARALILAQLGRTDEASISAELALQAASEEQSEFRKHRRLGLVTSEYRDVIDHLRRYCDA